MNEFVFSSLLAWEAANTVIIDGIAYMPKECFIDFFAPVFDGICRFIGVSSAVSLLVFCLFFCFLRGLYEFISFVKRRRKQDKFADQ